MLDFFSSAWNFEYALLPCIAAYLVFDLPIIVRRITRKLYVPIYFAFFPAAYSDELLARYFDEDDFGVVGGPIPENQQKIARIKIVAVAVGSLALTMMLSPLAASLFGTYFLSDSEFIQFVWTLAVVKAAMLVWAYVDLRYQFNISHRVPIGLLATIYTVYWVALIYFTLKIKEWVERQDSLGGFPKVLEGLLDYLIIELGVGIIFVAVVGSIVVWWLTERKVDENA